MNASVFLLTAALLGANEPQLPPNHPPMNKPGPVSPNQPLPPNHPPMPGAGAPVPSAQPMPMQAPMAAQGQPPAPNDEELLRALEKMGDPTQSERAFEVANGAGRLFYTRGRFSEAVKYLGDAATQAEPTRKLFIAQKAKLKGAALPTAEAAGCSSTGEVLFVELHKKAQAHAAAGRAGEAAACARVALEPAQSGGELLAQALFLEKQPDAALTRIDQVLEAEPERMSAVYLRGMIRFDSQPDDVKSLVKAKADLQKYLPSAGNTPRASQVKQVLARIDQAIPEGGVTALDRKLAKERKLTAQQPLAPAGMPPGMGMGQAPMAAAGAGGPGAGPLSPEMVEAVQNTERTPELEAGLAKLVEEGEGHLAAARYQEALDVYKRVVPFQPENGRAKAGMAWSLVGLGKPMADRIWSVAVQSDAASVDRLGETLRKKGDEKGAKALWKKLSETDPAYAAQSGLSLKMK